MKTKTPILAHRPVPLVAKLLMTLFVAVLVPVYLRVYGPTNFIYFCDAALLLTLAGMWLESPLLIGMCCVGILLPQLYWLIDFFCQALGIHLTDLTAYMFKPTPSLFVRGLSFFHGWLPILLLWLVFRLGYDRRSLVAWGLVATVLVVTSYLFLPHSGQTPARLDAPVNVNYVTGFSDTIPESWLSPPLYVAAYLAALWACVFLPTHLILRRIVRPAPAGKLSSCDP